MARVVTAAVPTVTALPASPVFACASGRVHDVLSPIARSKTPMDTVLGRNTQIRCFGSVVPRPPIGGSHRIPHALPVLSIDTHRLPARPAERTDDPSWQ